MDLAKEEEQSYIPQPAGHVDIFPCGDITSHNIDIFRKPAECVLVFQFVTLDAKLLLPCILLVLVCWHKLVIWCSACEIVANLENI
mmetsp:Transcript_31162/g.49986  ORF Transcript_31162/g.49986 Transcript_31162/m.49986 type:complete len:86 (+) Transcript_31162:2710-2967(+)